jgi:hypothetical protein
MPVFYFQISDGAELSDREGVAFETPEQAVAYAVRLRAVVAERASLEREKSWRILVSNENGKVIVFEASTAAGTPAFAGEPALAGEQLRDKPKRRRPR